MKRSTWHVRTSAIVLAWLASAGVVAALHRQIPAATWLMVHLLLLGAVTTAILVWSWHFSVAVLRAPQPESRRAEATRLTIANAGALAVAGGVAGNQPGLVVIGAIGLIGAVVAHVVALVQRLRQALPARFAVTVHAYVAAGVLLVPGIAFGVLLARGSYDPDTEQRLLLAHVAVNLLGWVGLPIMGTLVTLWPTILRTRLTPDAERYARRALPLLIIGTLLATLSAVAGLDAAVSVAVTVYLAGVALTIYPMLQEMRQRPPASFAGWSVLVGVIWLAIGVFCFAIAVAVRDDFGGVANLLVAAVVVGGILQILLGALSYLLPVMIGGGPAAMRRRNARVDRALAPRLVLLNGSLLLTVLTSASAVRVASSALVLVAVAWTAFLIAESLRPFSEDESRHASTPAQPTHRQSGGAVVAFAAVALAVVAGVAVDPAAIGSTAVSAPSASAGVAATGATTEVSVKVSGMRFVPNRIEVPAGNALELTVTNTGSDVHDLVLETGQRTPRLSPGQSATITVDVVGRVLAGWCSVAGHRQMGMVLEIAVIGAPIESSTVAVEPMSHTATHDSATAAAARPDLMATPGPDVSPIDATLPPADASRTHRMRLVVTEVVQEVAPGIRQTRWTFGGTAPGPVLRGRIGDTFVITLVNDGSIGHSIDFHAGALAPDKPMRTIAPGEELEVRFTATRAGIWMYHCSTMPMSMHIANGMFGAVVIDPPDLAPVDHEFLIVQSESYLGPDGETADAEAIADQKYDLVSFNGYPMQYDHRPLEVGVGERIRMWVLDAGPNVGSSFHVVGSQFDTVYREGRYELTPGEGGSQVLGLFPAQGGFVEFTLPEAGHYPFVSHAMSDAEKGAHGTIVAIPRS